MSSTSEVGSFAIGPTVGLATGNSITAFRITGEAQYTLMEIIPKLYLDLAGHVGLQLGGINGVGCDFVDCGTTTIFEIAPAARVRYSLLDDKLSFFGDGGIGIAFASLGFGSSFGNDLSVSETWFLLRFAAGVQYKVAPHIILYGEPLGLNIYIGDGSGFMYSLAGGVLFSF